ncbi:14351_t:CDS:1, partial [Gigaspora margarita]
NDHPDDHLCQFDHWLDHWLNRWLELRLECLLEHRLHIVVCH